MCLESVTATYPQNDNMVVGYKTFCMMWGHPYSPYRNGCYRVGKHHKSNNVMIYGSDLEVEYESGFHFFFNKQDAFDHIDYAEKVYEVHMWDIRTEGSQWYKSVGVAKNMRIIGQVNGGLI